MKRYVFSVKAERPRLLTDDGFRVLALG